MSDGGEFTLAHEEIGSGGYGTVCKATHNATGELVAAKRIKTSRMKLSAIEKEVALMRDLQHPHIIALRGCAQIGKEYIIFMCVQRECRFFSSPT